MSQNSDGSETAINEDHLYFIRQVRKPVSIPSISYGSKCFKEIIENYPDQTSNQNLLLHYEQFFARIELLSRLIRFEAMMRQLIRSHLVRRVGLSDLNHKHLLDEKTNIIKGTLSLLRTLAHKEYNQTKQNSFPFKAFETLLNKLNTYYTDPLILLRNAMCHGNIRDYIQNLTNSGVPTAGISACQNSDGRAISIYENIDAVSYYMLSENIAILHRLTYAPLHKYKPGHLLTRIIDDANYTHKTGYMTPAKMWKDLSVEYLKFDNKELREACIEPSKLYTDFAEKCQVQIY